MKFKFWQLLLLSALTSLFANFLRHNSLLVIFANTALFIGYASLFQHAEKLPTGKADISSKFMVLPFLSFMPIFTFDHLFPFIYLIEAGVLVLWFFLARSRRNCLHILVLVALLAYLYFVVSSNHLISWLLELKFERLIFPQHLYQLEIDRQQKESMYLLYKLRFLTFNEITTYGYVFMGNIFTFLSFENLYRSVLVVNVFFVIVGFFHLRKLTPIFRFLTISSLIISMIAVGLIKTPDSMRPLSSLRGILLLLTINGISQKFSWLIYLSFFILSMFINNILVR